MCHHYPQFSPIDTQHVRWIHWTFHLHIGQVYPQDKPEGCCSTCRLTSGRPMQSRAQYTLHPCQGIPYQRHCTARIHHCCSSEHADHSHNCQHLRHRPFATIVLHCPDQPAASLSTDQARGGHHCNFCTRLLLQLQHMCRYGMKCMRSYRWFLRNDLSGTSFVKASEKA